MVDIAIGLIKVTVPIPVIPIPEIELTKVIVDFLSCLAGRNFLGVPIVYAVSHKVPNARATVRIVNVSGMVKVIVVSAGIPRGQGPVGHIAVDGITV